jgi:type IV pilus assembly protein PilV
MMTRTVSQRRVTWSARHRRGERGSTLIEAMAAGAVFAVGLLGLLAAQTMGAKQNWMASKESRATAIARDAANAVRRWPYPSPAADTTLANDPSNDAMVLVSGAIASPPIPASFEHDINADNGLIQALPNAAIDFNNDNNPDFMRLLHVAPLLVNGQPSGITVSVVVAWSADVGWRQVVLPVVKYDPTLNFATIPGI